jgi:hypothetical protein
MFDGIVSLLKQIPRPKEWVPEKASVCGRKAGRSAAVLASPACRQESDSTAELSAQQRDGHSEWRNHVRAQGMHAGKNGGASSAIRTTTGRLGSSSGVKARPEISNSQDVQPQQPPHKE